MKNYSVLSSVKNLPFMASLVSVKYFKSFKESYIFLLIIMLSDLSVWCWKTGAPVLRKCFFKLVFVSLCFYKIKHELIFKIWRKVFFEKLSLNCLHLGLLTSPSTQNYGSCMFVNLLNIIFLDFQWVLPWWFCLCCLFNNYKKHTVISCPCLSYFCLIFGVPKS